MNRGFTDKGYGTANASKWDTVVAAVNVCDSMFDLLSETQPQSSKGMEALTLAASARDIMWATPAPDLKSLAWKLEQAVYYADYEGEPDHPLNRVLADLRRLGAN